MHKALSGTQSQPRRCWGNSWPRRDSNSDPSVVQSVASYHHHHHPYRCSIFCFWWNRVHTGRRGYSRARVSYGTATALRAPTCVHCGVLCLFMRDRHDDACVLSAYNMQQEDADRIQRHVEPWPWQCLAASKCLYCTENIQPQTTRGKARPLLSSGEQ